MTWAGEQYGQVGRVAGALPSAGAPRFDPRQQPPETLYLSLPTSEICNYRCRHCHIWRHELPVLPLSRARRLELLAEFAAWRPGGTVVLPGGEVTLDLEELMAVARACRAHRLPLIVLTNGSRIRTPELACELASSGITNLVVSLDSHRPELHNYTRGVATAYQETVGAIRLLVAAAAAPGSALSVQTACVVFKDNLDELDQYVEFCRGLGVRHVDFQLLARTFSNAHRSRDVFFEKHFWHAPAEKAAAKRRLAELISRWAEDPLVIKKPADLDWMLTYVDDPDFRVRNPVCGSHERNLLIDATGRAALCFNTAAILEAPFVGDARERSLHELWAGPKAAADRQVMDGCRLNCGALNCHRRATEPAGVAGG